jgi:hypothetical protein
MLSIKLLVSLEIFVEIILIEFIPNVRSRWMVKEKLFSLPAAAGE